MMKQLNYSKVTKALFGAGVLSLALAGCGSDGDDGADGPDGVIGVHINAAKSVNTIFTNATIDEGVVTVDFKLENDNGVAVLGLTKDHDLRFGIAQLVQVYETMPDVNGNEVEYDRGLQWQAYINKQKEPGDLPDDTSHLDPGTRFQADVEKANACDDCLIDNEDGSYTYTFQQNIADVTTPIVVTYDAENTHRATLELELPTLASNGNFNWQPSSGLTEGIATRDVVAIETCYTCHQPDSLAFHGGRRIDIENCASCHTATSGDPESGNSIDFAYMIHALHKGNARKTYAPDSTDPLPDENGMIPAPYKIVGYGGKLIDYGKVMFPQDPAAECSSCHVTGEDAPADAELFTANKSNEACIGCHTTVPKAYHMEDNRNCISCHIEEGYGRSGVEGHGDITKPYNVSKDYSVTFSNIKPAIAPNQGISFDVQFFDDKGTPIAKEFIFQQGYTNPYIVASWDIEQDYPAYETGSKYSERRINIFDTAQASYSADTKIFSVFNANFILPDDINGKHFELLPLIKTCFKKGGYGRPLVEPIACDSGSVTQATIQSEPLRFVWDNGFTDTPADERREIVDSTKCSSCHGAEFYHYSNGATCQSCHTADKSLKESERGSGIYDLATSYAFKAHHADGHYLKYAGVGSGTVVKTDCVTCHTDDGFKLGRSPDRVWRYPNLSNPTDNIGLFASSDAGACLSCHQKYISESGVAHIETNGGIVNAATAEEARTLAAESCSTCHTPKQLMEIHNK